MIHVDLKCIDNFLFFAVLILKREKASKMPTMKIHVVNHLLKYNMGLLMMRINMY